MLCTQFALCHDGPSRNYQHSTEAFGAEHLLWRYRCRLFMPSSRRHRPPLAAHVRRAILFLQAPLVWATYRLSTVVHEILPTKDRDLDDVETAPGSNMMSSRAMDVVGESTDEKQENDIPR
jgi:hypothetical protein